MWHCLFCCACEVVLLSLSIKAKSASIQMLPNMSSVSCDTSTVNENNKKEIFSQKFPVLT